MRRPPLLFLYLEKEESYGQPAMPEKAEERAHGVRPYVIFPLSPLRGSPASPPLGRAPPTLSLRRRGQPA